MSDCQGSRACLGSICGLDSHDLAEATRRSGTSAPWSRANWPMMAVSAGSPQGGANPPGNSSGWGR